MKKSCLLASVGALCLAASLSLTCQAGQQVQNYAHPALFGSQTQVRTTADANYVVAGNVKIPTFPIVAPYIAISTLSFGLSFALADDYVYAVMAFATIGGLMPFALHNIYGTKYKMFLILLKHYKNTYLIFQYNIME